MTGVRHRDRKCTYTKVYEDPILVGVSQRLSMSTKSPPRSYPSKHDLRSRGTESLQSLALLCVFIHEGKNCAVFLSHKKIKYHRYMTGFSTLLF